jgi:hypothetical protein
MHFTARERERERENKAGEIKKKERENRNSERDRAKRTSEDHGITTNVINGILSSLHVKLG